MFKTAISENLAHSPGTGLLNSPAAPVSFPRINDSRHGLAFRRMARFGLLLLGLAVLSLPGDGPRAWAQPGAEKGKFEHFPDLRQLERLFGEEWKRLEQKDWVAPPGQKIFFQLPPPRTKRPRYSEIPMKDGEFAEALQDALREFQDKQAFHKHLQEMLKKYQDGKDFKIDPEILKSFDLENPLIKKQIKNLLDDPTLNKLPLDQKKKDEIKEFIKKLEMPGDDPLSDVEPGPQQADEPETLVDGPGTETVADQEPHDPLGDWFDGWIEELEHSELGKQLLESEEFRNFILEMHLLRPESQESFLGLDAEHFAGWLGKMPNVEWKNPLANAPRIKWGNFSLPPLPRLNVRMPKMGGPPPSSLPDPGSLSAGGVVLVVLLLGGVLVILTLLLRGTPWVAGRAGKWRPGPWPVDPARVATRGELVRAFEYLALLLLGREAEHFNHRTIAERIGDSRPSAAPERRQAAEQLADMYEHARYAPVEEALEPEDIRRARENLCSLAGAAQA